MKEIDQILHFETWLSGNSPLESVAIQSLDLRSFKDKILRKSFDGVLFLGCQVDLHIAGHIACTGGTLIPCSENLAFNSHESQLYSPERLFKGFDPEFKDAYQQTHDYKIFLEYLEQGKNNPKSIYVSLMRRLHDHSITDALHEAIEGKKLVAIMGGHGMERSDSFYREIAFLARKLTRKGFTMISGGGPGAMEATHLGAFFATKSELQLEEALQILQNRPQGAIPGKEYADQDWLHRAFRVIDRFPLLEDEKADCMSIGIPTWLYGHEPPAPFATHIAKYFANSVREEGLLAIAKHGVIFAPGSAGTIQEIFQDACQNHYAPYHQKPGFQYVSPMILFGEDWWKTQKPVWPLLHSVSEGNRYGQLLHLTDDTQEIFDRILNYDPKKYQYPECGSMG